MERFPQKNIYMQAEVPLYLIAEWRRHLKRIVKNVGTDPSDTRTRNALRLARKDLEQMDKYLSQ